MFAAELVAVLDECLERKVAVINRDGHTFDEFNGDILGFVRCVFDGRAPIENGVVVWLELW